MCLLRSPLSEDGFDTNFELIWTNPQEIRSCKLRPDCGLLLCSASSETSFRVLPQPLLTTSFPDVKDNSQQSGQGGRGHPRDAAYDFPTSTFTHRALIAADRIMSSP